MAKYRKSKSGRYRKGKSKYSDKPSKSFARKVKKVINAVAEKKYHDIQAGTQSPDTSGVVVDLSAVPQDTTVSGDTVRVGDEIYIRSLQIRGNIIDADSYNAVRVIVFQWLMDTSIAGAAPTVANILQSIAGGYGTLSSFNHDSHTQYRILYDKVFLPDTDDPIKYFKFYCSKFYRKKISFTAGGTGAANKLYLLLISDSSVASHPRVDYVTRLNFTDM